MTAPDLNLSREWSAKLTAQLGLAMAGVDPSQTVAIAAGALSAVRMAIAAQIVRTHHTRDAAMRAVEGVADQFRYMLGDDVDAINRAMNEELRKAGAA